MSKINKCTAYSGLMFAYVAFLTGVLGAALPYWITTKDNAFEFMNLGFWKYCKQIDLERTACHYLIDDSTGVKKWLKDARITGCSTAVFLTIFWVLANIYSLRNVLQGSRIVMSLLMFTAASTIALEVATMVLFCFGRDDHEFIDFDGPVKLSHSFYLAMSCVTCLINSAMMMGCDVWETYRREKNAYTPPSAKFLEDLQKEAALLREQGKFDEFEREEFGDFIQEDAANAFPPHYRVNVN